MLIKQIGNDIHPSIQLEVDHPSSNRTKIFDFKVRVETREKKTEKRVQMVSVIMHDVHSSLLKQSLQV